MTSPSELKGYHESAKDLLNNANAAGGFSLHNAQALATLSIAASLITLNENLSSLMAQSYGDTAALRCVETHGPLSAFKPEPKPEPVEISETLVDAITAGYDLLNTKKMVEGLIPIEAKAFEKLEAAVQSLCGDGSNHHA